METEVLLPDYGVDLLDRPERFIIIYGSRGGTKSQTIARSIALKTGIEEEADTAVVREFKLSAGEDGAIALIYQVALEMGIPVHKPARGNRLTFPITGSQVFPLGSERNKENLRGLERVKYAWWEEAQSISKESFDIGEPSVRLPGSKHIISFNPRYSTDIAYRMAVTEPINDAYIVNVNYGDYPEFMSEALDGSRQRMLDSGDPDFPHVWLGKLKSAKGLIFDGTKLVAVDEEPPMITQVRNWDLAATEGEGDFTVGLKLGKRKDGGYHICDIVRGRWSPDGVDEQLVKTAKADGRQCNINIEQEPGSAGKIASNRFHKLLAGFRITTNRSTGSKADRAQPAASATGGGIVSVPRDAHWLGAFLEEIAAFTDKETDYSYDDQVDAYSGGFNWLTKPRSRISGGVGRAQA